MHVFIIWLDDRSVWSILIGGLTVTGGVGGSGQHTGFDLTRVRNSQGHVISPQSILFYISVAKSWKKKWLFNLLGQNCSLWHFNYMCRRSELHGFKSVFSLMTMLKCSKPFYATALRKHSYIDYLTDDNETVSVKPFKPLSHWKCFNCCRKFFLWTSWAQNPTSQTILKGPVSIHNYKSSVPVQLNGSSLSDVMLNGTRLVFFSDHFQVKTHLFRQCLTIYLSNAWNLVLQALHVSVCLFKMNRLMVFPI